MKTFAVLSMLYLSTSVSPSYAQQQFWDELNISLNEYINCMAVGPQGTIAVGTSTGVYLSTDGGSTWAARRDGIATDAYVSSLAADDNGDLYAALYGKGIYRLPAGDTTWSTMNAGLTSLDVTAVAVEPDLPLLMTGTGVHGAFLRRPDDTAWIPMDTSLSDMHVECILPDTVNHSLFVGTWSGVFRSTDSGATWARMGGTTSFIVWRMTVNAKGVLFAGSTNEGIFRSNDNGTTWVPKNTMMFDSLVSNLVVNTENELYASTMMGVFVSTDDGDSWTNLFGITARVNYLTFDKENYLYAATSHGTVYRSKASTVSAVEELPTSTPTDFTLFPSYPNPFNPSTVIRFHLPAAALVTVTIFDVTGKHQTSLLHSLLRAGTHEVVWQAAAFPSGVYFCRVQAGPVSRSQKMLLLK